MKLYLRNIANSPHMVFVISWSLCLFLYSLHGAGILPKLTLNLFSFLIFFILLFGITSFFLKKIKFTIEPAKPVNINYRILLIVNSLIFLPNFFYSGIPILGGVRDDDFGIAGLVTIAISFNAFTCVCCYYMYLVTKKKKLLLYCAYCLSLFAIIISRGLIIMTLVTMFFLWMNLKNPLLTFKRIIIITAGLLFVLYIFGVAGNLRSENALATISNPDNPDYSDIKYSSDIILDVGDAAAVFRNNTIPGEYFWSYLYVTSPLSNLQYNINITSPPFTANNFYLVVVNETLFDFISKRINYAHKGYLRKMPVLLIDNLTVSTTLAGSYASAGWGGMLYFIMVFWSLPIFYILLIAKNRLAIIGISSLCTVYLFSVFSNMLVLTGLSIQIFYPIVLMLFQNMSFKKDSSLLITQGKNVIKS